MTDAEPSGSTGRERLLPTPSQTAGPFVSIGASWNAGGVMLSTGGGPEIVLSGRVIDGAGAPVTDALLEFFQADAQGRYPPGTEPGWTGFARSLTDADGWYRLRTCKPGRVQVPELPHLWLAPHVEVSLLARGLMQRLVTRLYFADEEEANTADPVLTLVEPDLQSRMTAGRQEDGYRLDIWLQGDHESVFVVP